jgi:hypothetical protein
MVLGLKVTDLGHPKMALFGKEKDDQPLDSLVFLGPLTYSVNGDLTLWLSNICGKVIQTCLFFQQNWDVTIKHIYSEWGMLASNPLISSIDRQSFWFTIGMEIDQQRDGDSRNAACWGCVQSPRVQHVEIQRNHGITETVSKHRRTTLVFCDRSII